MVRFPLFLPAHFSFLERYMYMKELHDGITCLWKKLQIAIQICCLHAWSPKFMGYEVKRKSEDMQSVVYKDHQRRCLITKEA